MSRARRSAGFTIIEFMIAITLSLLVLAALTAAFVASSRSRTEIEKANEQIENGRFGLQILTDDLEMAGFYSHLDIDLAMDADTPLDPPASKPNACTPAASAANLTALRAALPMHIQGYDSLAALDADLDTCLVDFKPGTDIVVIRRVATCVGGDPNCAMLAGAPYFQASLCETHLESLNYTEYFKLETTVANLNRTQRDCATSADRRQYLVHIYYIATNDGAGSNVPTLMRAELGNAADPDDFTVVALAHGIEDLQLQYGIDNTNDGAPDAFTADPDTYDAPGGAAGPHADCAAHAAECVTNWRNVMVLRLNLLARNSSESRDHLDTKVYTLGTDAAGNAQCAHDPDDDGDCDAFGDKFKRHVYQTSVRLNNPAGRRDS